MKTNQNDVTRTARRKSDRAERVMRRHRIIKGGAMPARSDRIRITPLGGQNGIGEKNMIVIEYGDDVLILDCGFDLGVDLPGINYSIPATDYLESVRHKIRGYVISHGHLDHTGGLIHIVPQYPAPIFGSKFTIGMIRGLFEKAHESGLNFDPDCHVVDMDSHEKVRLGKLVVELIRVTHSVPESSAIVVDTPAGRVINTGDFRLDPEPLDAMPTDISRLKKLGDEGVLLLMSESVNTTRLGRTPTEHTLQDSFNDLIRCAKGRVITAVFSTNMNRIQMIVNAAHHHGRKVALDGRSMIAVAELAVRLGNLKVPKGVLVSMRDATALPDNQMVVICTGGQGEPGAAMSRMATGEHRTLKLKRGDSVVISSTPIPGNEQSYQEIGDYLAQLDVTLYRHPTHEIDGSGPLHVSGHAFRDEYAEMVRLIRPKYFMPIYGGALSRKYHQRIAQEEGIAEEHIIMADNGVVVELSNGSAPKRAGKVTSGALLVDQTGSVVPEIVTRDRMLLKEDGFIVVVMTLDQKTGRPLSSPDILTRGHISVQGNPELTDGLRAEVRKVTHYGNITRATVELLKHRLKDAVSDYTYRHTNKTPIIIPVVNVIGVHGKMNKVAKPVADSC